MFHPDFLPLADGVVQGLRQWDSAWKIHPILVDFTAALVPVSIASDMAARVLHRESLRAAGWWTMLYAGVITPFTALFGWLFWMKDDIGVEGMTIHKWLGTSLAVLLIVLLVWRINIHRKKQVPSWAYLLIGVCFVAALIYQGMLGGKQTFGGM